MRRTEHLDGNAIPRNERFVALLPKVLDVLAGMEGGHDRATWEVFSRKLRDAGDLAPSKRGAGASDVSPGDAARLLIGGMATDSPARASECVRRFWPLQLQAHAEFSAFAVLDGCRLDTFGEAVEDLIEHALPIGASLAKRAMGKRRRPVDVAQLRGSFEAKLSVDRSAGLARLTVGELRGSEMRSADLTWAAAPGPRPTLDWSNTATVSVAAIMALSLAVSEGGA